MTDCSIEVFCALVNYCGNSYKEGYSSIPIELLLVQPEEVFTMPKELNRVLLKCKCPTKLVLFLVITKTIFIILANYAKTQLNEFV